MSHEGSPPDRDPIDRRQRVVAAIMLSAVDLPFELGRLALLTIEAAKACPNINCKEAAFGKGRRLALEHARALIDEMLGEIAL